MTVSVDDCSGKKGEREGGLVVSSILSYWLCCSHSLCKTRQLKGGPLGEHFAPPHTRVSRSLHRIQDSLTDVVVVGKRSSDF